MRAIPLTLQQANNLVTTLHRHHKHVVGHRWSIGVKDDNGVIHGAAIVGRPVARKTDQYFIAEITRLVTDGTPNACSFLYSTCARIAKEMGFQSIQTFILDSEPGTSLKAAGWQYVSISAGGDWNCKVRQGRRTDQPMTPKQKWQRMLRTSK